MNSLSSATRCQSMSLSGTDYSCFVSVIVPIRNEERAILSTLEQLLEQDYDPARFEIIVVDGDSTDGTRSIVEQFVWSYSQVKLVRNRKRWSSSARNLGIQAARGDVIVIIDGHCDIGNRYYLAELVAAFDRTGAHCLGRPQPLSTNRPNRLQKVIGVARRSRLGHHPDSQVFSSQERVVPASSIAVAYRRTVFERVGLFDESFDACEDVEFNHRIDEAGLCCVLVPTLAVSYHPRATLPALFRQMMRYGRGRMRLLRKHPETFSVLGFAPAFLILTTALGPLSMLWSVNFVWLYIAMLGTYATALLLASVEAAVVDRQWSLISLLPVVLLTLHAGAGVGIVLEAVISRRQRHWQNGGDLQ